jgi:hypothetical protein
MKTMHTDMIKKFAKVFVLVGLVAALLLVAIVFAWQITEKYFFDRVFYQKSALHGYPRDEEQSFNLMGTPKHHWAIEQRLTDLRTLWRHEAENTDYPEKFDKSVFKVAFIGDSYVYGTGVLGPERISAVLEKKLNTIQPTKVYAFAQMADDVMDYYANFLLAERRLKPDLYIVSMVWNDFEVWGGKQPIQDTLRQRLQTICKQTEFKEGFSPKTNSWLEIIRDHSVHSISPANNNYCYMNEFIKDIQTDRRVLFFNFNHFEGPRWCQPGDAVEHIYHSFVMTEYENLVYQNDGVVFGINVEDWSKWESASPEEAHPAKTMHALGAQIIVNELLRDSVWGFVNQPVELQ